MYAADGGGGGPPYPEPVQFDQAAASDAVEALRGAVRLLQQVMSTDVPLGNRALSGWQGPHARTFSTTFSTWQRTTVPQMIADYQRWIGIIDGAGQSAVAEQAAHDRANQAWQAAQKPGGSAAA